MHLGNGAITPECGLVALGIAATGVGIGLVSARATGLNRNHAIGAGALGAAVFAAQTFNLPIWPHSSAHLVGGVILAWMLGPALGLLGMTVVLTLQALLLGDGGLMALGANVVNMGLVPVAAVVAVERLGLRRSRHAAAALGGAAFLVTLLGAALIVVEVAIGRGATELAGWSSFAWRMLTAHACAGLLEGASTVAIVALLNSPASIAAETALPPRKSLLVGLASVLIALIASPSLGLTSAMPDAYQAALAAANPSGNSLGGIESPDRLSGVTALVESYQESIAQALPVSKTAIAMLGTIAAGLGAACCALCCWRRPDLAGVAMLTSIS